MVPCRALSVAHTPGPRERTLVNFALGAWIKGSTGEWVALACGGQLLSERLPKKKSSPPLPICLVRARRASVASEDALLADLRADGELPDLTEKPWTLVDADGAPAIAKATEVPLSSAKLAF